jgi:HPt (histidine-containing phosphotransfer) domain-containing protein
MVDVTRIEELYDEIGEEAVTAVLAVFAAEARRTIDDIEAGLDGPGYAAAIHFLRSGALNLGLNSLADSAAAVANAQAAERPRAARDLRRILDRCAQMLNLGEEADLP